MLSPGVVAPVHEHVHATAELSTNTACVTLIATSHSETRRMLTCVIKKNVATSTLRNS